MKKVPSNPNKILNPFRDIGKEKKVNDPKSKGRCFHCGIAGYWKRNCPNYLAQKKNLGITELPIVEVSFIAGTSNSWCVDSGATNHICNMLQGF